MTPLGLGLIGLGRHGQRYAQHLLEGIPNCQLVAVCRRNAREGQRFAQQYGLRFYQHYHDLLADPQVQAIVLVIPPAEAIPIALDVMRGKKPLLIEKPLGCTAHEAIRVLQGSRTFETPLMVAHTLRYEEAVIQLKAHAGKVGTWQYLVLTNRLRTANTLDGQGHCLPPRGTLLEIGIHQIDLLRFLTGDEVTKVACELERRPSGGPDCRAWASLQTDGGLPCLLDISRVSHTRVTRAEIIGETGQLIADWTAHSLLLVREGEETISIPFVPQPTIPRVIAAFVHAIQRNTAVPISALDGLRAVEIADACYESAECTNTVYVKRHQES